MLANFLKKSQIDSLWIKELSNILASEKVKDLFRFLDQEIKKEKVIYPKRDDIFKALELTSFEKVKVIILGQDPYHGADQAHGLAFSVKKTVKIPPSLKNIYKERKDDLGIEIPTHGDLRSWATQGVLLLNSVLTVEESKPASHRNMGWELITDEIIRCLSLKKKNLVFILWGNDAKKKESLIDHEKHLILKSAHPSPFSYQLFKGNKHFSKTNSYLSKHEIECINWEN